MNNNYSKNKGIRINNVSIKLHVCGKESNKYYQTFEYCNNE